MHAVDPGETVWLSASAGTGKTEVLSSRVLRLLLRHDVEPSQILCLTFTKAGATEMAARINRTLAEWVRLDDTQLFMRLEAIGADTASNALARARTLFAAVLDCPGGGLRIDTIHAFSQWLLATFPLEAELTPGSRPMEDRERHLLARQVLADLLVEAEQGGSEGTRLLDAVADLSVRHGPDAVLSFLLRCAASRAAWFGQGSWQPGDMRARVLRLLDLPADADESWVAAMCSDEQFDWRSLRRCAEINQQWGTKTGLDASVVINGWLAGEPAQRISAIDSLAGVFLTQKGTPKASGSQEKIDPAYADYSARVIASIETIRATVALLALAGRLVPALVLGRAFAMKWDEAKQREGLIDFDDQIRRAADLLRNKEQADWIRYKLDRRFDHILVDEAQDTNAAQWDIIFAMAEEFWAGIGQRGDVMRTLFVVGDYKQAIFRFQGTSPENFRRAADRVRREMLQAADNAAMLRSNDNSRKLVELGLDRSFRTAQNVLEFVDKAIAGIGHEMLGLSRPAEAHQGQDRPGYVALWRPISESADDSDDEEDEDDGTSPRWLSRPDRRMAENIAKQVKAWLDPLGPGLTLVKGGPHRATAGDIMILVRQRKELAGLIVARLHAAGVPVAGVDRLRLGAPLAVKDLVSALRFAAQPLEDLNLASLLVSPLIGWSQEQLLLHGYRDDHVALWNHLKQSSDADVLIATQQLRALLALSDYQLPHELIYWLLVGPWQGRRRLVARLGSEANDPIDELINAARAYAATGTPSLVGFLAWFDAGDGELKRDADNADGLVRVMTVHGSKGLQAPIVILADAAGNPENAREGGVDLTDPANDARTIPLPPITRADRQGRIADTLAANRKADEEEHWRLLYVAMTRAEEALFVGGALGRRDGRVPPPKSWYAQLRALFDADAELADPIWGGRCEHGQLPPSVPAEQGMIELPLEEPLPTWASRAPTAEPRPPRPLAPSSLGEDDSPNPPLPPGAGREAARRGTLMHKLLERLPEVAGERRADAAAVWLERHAGDMPSDERKSLLSSALAVIDEPEWGDLFGPGSLAEVPVTAIVGGQVIAGTIDRLVIAPDVVRLVDYKSARRPPNSIEEAPRSVLRQMGAYAAALGSTFPGRRIEAALLYTATPRLIPIPQSLLAEHKPGLPGAE
jgi:double-strand break repair helicase AddA, alphaproteobacterial type